MSEHPVPPSPSVRLRRRARCIAASMAVAALLGCAAPPRTPGVEGTARDLVNRATISIATFDVENDHPAFRASLRQSCAVLLFPAVASAEFLAGASSGDGLLLVRDAASGHWMGPAFYAMNSGELGLQIGAARRELVVSLRNCDALPALYEGRERLRVGTSAAAQAAERGEGLAVSRDVQVFSRVKGLFVGLSVNATVFHARPALTAAWYGRAITPAEIFDPARAGDETSQELRAAMERAAR